MQVYGHWDHDSEQEYLLTWISSSSAACVLSGFLWLIEFFKTCICIYNFYN